VCAQAANLEEQNHNLRQRERILSMSVSSCEQNLQMQQSDEKLSSYLTALLQVRGCVSLGLPHSGRALVVAWSLLCAPWCV